MGWSLGFDSRWQRDVGYGVPAVCDQPRCAAQIDRGLSFVCGAEPYGGELGCGLYFCSKHLSGYRRDKHVCARCSSHRPPYDPKPDVKQWVDWKLTDDSWAQWRTENPKEVALLRKM